MKHPERVEEYLNHIAQAIQRATDYIDRLGGVSAFRQSQRDQDAVIRNMEIIGEAARQIQQHAPQFVAAHPELPWIEMRGMRNKMIHEYFDVDVDVVWRTVKSDLPALKQRIDDLLKRLRGAAPRTPPRSPTS
ncbi:uncharacterized protein with HEPN domain [Roseiarcus fermentans]|uniref:Uncharacterized protein with HEPN domain n=1 Tax=Roseiarcus fermentans TaxID=1473586 RepID=A0A366F3R4_9HYPH|nr:DUF86 domain-containing protein [Roseiarcus fermentans]RBP08620.1 uncharacterized protein with HEPN domain [Roseiarcus fermentans]